MGTHLLKANLRSAAAIMVIIVIIAGCQNSQSCQDPIGCIFLNPGQPLTIGIEKATTGDESAISQSMVDAIKFANSQQPLFYRHAIQFYIQETPCTLRDQNLTTGLLLSQPDLAAVIGPACQVGADDYAKALSDSGFSLLSPAIAIDAAEFPGVYSVFPSSQALAEALDLLLIKSGEYTNVGLVVWNEAVDIQFSNDFCILWQKHAYQCSQVLSLEPGEVDLSGLSSQLANRSASPIFILPFSSLGQIPDFAGVPGMQKALFFDPRLSTWDDSQDPNLNHRTIVTYSLPAKILDSVHFPTAVLPDMRSYLAYDTYRMLIQSLSDSVEMRPDGKITILRQKLRQAIEKTADFNGLAGTYSCADRNKCLQTGGFLTLRKSNP